MGIDVAGAITALADAGLRARISPSTVLVVQTHDGVRGLLDPMRGSSPGQSCLSASDPVVSTAELADLIEAAAGESGAALRNAIAEARGGTPSTPAGLAAALAPLTAPARRTSASAPARVIAAAGLLLVVIAVAVIAHERSGGSTTPRPVTHLSRHASHRPRASSLASSSA